MFSFNSPYGACPECDGLGMRMEIDPDLVINKNLTIREGGILPWSGSNSRWLHAVVESVCAVHGIDMDVPIGELSEEQIEVLLYGSGTQSTSFSIRTGPVASACTNRRLKASCRSCTGATGRRRPTGTGRKLKNI